MAHSERSVQSPLGPSRRMVATSDFSGLTSSPWALASAEAKVPIEGLDRCMAAPIDIDDIETDSSRLRPLGSHAMADRLLGILRHQALELHFGLLVFESGRPVPRRRLVRVQDLLWVSVPARVPCHRRTQMLRRHRSA
jgi:hypothetical protein